MIFSNWLPNFITYLGNNSFQFINIRHDFKNVIDWDISVYGKLWTYNLNYFDFINQEGSQKNYYHFIDFLHDYAKKIPNLKTANESYPTSVRILNWIKFFIKNNIDDKELNKSLYNQCYILNNNKEYHLLGNHFLENGFALTTGGIYFQDKYLFYSGKKILFKELNEQILNDGSHFELSPMYHSLILSRLLDVVNLIKSNKEVVNSIFLNQDSFSHFLSQKASLMCSWLDNIKYHANYPHFNDSTYDISCSPVQIFNYARILGIKYDNVPLSDSGIRRLKSKSFDLIIKAGQIGPDYIPGHAHADSLSFECYINSKPFIVDPGITTYEKNFKRQLERSTKNHNTVTINYQNSSEVWGGFRVGKRAKTKIISCEKNSIEAYHDGYPVLHYRSISVVDKFTKIIDTTTNTNAEAHFHFHPDLKVELDGSVMRIGNINVKYENLKSIEIKDFKYSFGFNKSKNGKKAIVKFFDHLITYISI